MGVFDFVRNGVRELMVARPDNLKHLIVYKHPDQTVPMYAQLTVDSDECAVFFKDGRVMGVLPPGRHTLHTQNLPFLGQLVDRMTGGNVLIAELFFVKTSPLRSIPFGGPAGEIVDPGTGLQVPIRIFGEFSLVVTDPVRFVVGYTGQSAQAGDNDAIVAWIKGRFLNSVGTVLTELCEAEQKSVLSVINNKERLAQAFVQRAPTLNDVGVRILEMGRLEPNIPEEHMKELRQAVKELADAQREVKKKQIMVGGAAADAAARQFELDQKFQQDSRYVKELAGSYQGYAAGQAMIGAGQGMAAHGVDGGVAGAGMQMALGVNMAGAMAGQFAQQPPAAAPPPPQFSPGGVLVTCGSCQTKQPGGKFCAECGKPLVTPKRFCTGCGLEAGPSAKFCSGCGTNVGGASPGQPPASAG